MLDVCVGVRVRERECENVRVNERVRQVRFCWLLHCLRLNHTQVSKDIESTQTDTHLWVGHCPFDPGSSDWQRGWASVPRPDLRALHVSTHRPRTHRSASRAPVCVVVCCMCVLFVFRACVRSMKEARSVKTSLV